VAIAATLTTTKHPDADRLAVGRVLGYTVVVGNDTPSHVLGVFFPADTQLSHAFCVANKLYSKDAARELGLEDAGSYAGYLGVNRRVRAINLRGVKSEGIWLSPECLAPFGVLASDVNEGDEVSVVNGQEIARKYETPATLKQRNAQPAKRGYKVSETLAFPKHPDTEALQRFAETVPYGSIIYISEKLHGTSGRYANARTSQTLTGWKKWIATVLGIPVREHQYRLVHGSRNVIIGEAPVEGMGYYGDDTFRFNAMRGVVPLKGEVIYYEIVGHLPNGKAIMGSLPTPTHLARRYGEKTKFAYGCEPLDCKAYVYKIINVDEDGQITELSWPAVARRAAALGLDVVPLVSDPFIHRDTDRGAFLLDVAGFLTSGASTLDPTHIREGVVVRAETPDGRVMRLKLKSHDFLLTEGHAKEDVNYVDTESAA
jgi:hypothetical protein